VLLGTLPGGEPYALVGRDSAAVSRALLERHRNEENDDRVTQPQPHHRPLLVTGLPNVLNQPPAALGRSVALSC
jgi:hypothetical protein